MAKFNKLSWEEILKRFREIHGTKYIYDEKSYKDTHTKMRMYCSEKYPDGTVHGWFEKSPHKHISQKQGCPYCTHKKHTIDSLKHSIKMIHGDKYDLSNIVIYNNNKDYIYPICHCKDIYGNEHGSFKITVHNFLKGRGCPKCGQKLRHDKRTRTTDEFISESNIIHNFKYDYNLTDYKSIKDYVWIICHEKDCNGKEHGQFLQLAELHLRGVGCPKCGKTISQQEDKISDYIENDLGLKIERNNRKIIGNGKEIDIFVPSEKIGFEFDGMIWHSEKYKDDNKYHVDKTNICLKCGIKLFHIYENEFVKNRNLVLNKISIILGKFNGKKLGARLCKIQEIQKIDAEIFLNNFHLQGFVSSTIYIGAFYKDELVGVMSFKKYGNNWELTRFATNYKYLCQGLGGKLFKYFTRNYEYNEIKSFADRRWTVDEKNNIYTKLGFELESILKPDYAYTSNRGDYIHKFNFRKQTLHKKYGFPLTMTETEMATSLGYYKIWNCGLLKYIYKNPDK